MGIPPQPNYRAPYYQDTVVTVQVPSASSCAMTESCASVVNSMAGGASSDWRSTVYSEGPVNQQKMSEEQLRLFNCK
jgi:hypothetical protein